MQSVQQLSIRRGTRALLALIGLTGALAFLAGCHKEERVAPPNEKTAAPARLPGQTEEQKGNKGAGS